MLLFPPPGQMNRNYRCRGPRMLLKFPLTNFSIDLPPRQLARSLTIQYLKAASYGGYGQRGQNLYFNDILVFHVQGSIALHTPHSITTSQEYHHFGRSGKASACWLGPFPCSVENRSFVYLHEAEFGITSVLPAHIIGRRRTVRFVSSRSLRP